MDSQWKNEALALYQENKEFLKTLVKEDRNIFKTTLPKIHQEVFETTQCLECANCCRTTPALITESDAKRMAKHFQLSIKQVKRKYMLEDVNGEMTLNGVPCQFLNADNSCEIYEIRPEACRRYPHTDEAQFAERPKMNLANTLVCPAAFKIVERLKKSMSTI